MSHSNCCHCESENKSSSFVFGVILGAIIGAVIAVIIYKNQKSEVVETLKKKLTEFIDSLKDKYSSATSSSPTSSPNQKSTRKTKISSSPVIESVPILEEEIEEIIDHPKIKKPKTFVRPKR